QREGREAAFAADEALQDGPGHNTKMAKSARAYAKTYKPGPPLVPHIVVERIDFYIRRFNLSKRVPTLQLLCRYWSLKREARRGAPLLKRLHLEPRAASAGGGEGLKDLAFSAKKREKWKLERVRFICDVIDKSVFVHEQTLRNAFEKIAK
ncbi:hypothetical protein H0H87_001559, partial [Tephrocybe sp. NHM501043]